MKSFLQILTEAKERQLLESAGAQLQEDRITIDLPEFTRETLIEYLEENGVAWHEDDDVIVVEDPVFEAELSFDEDDLEESVCIHGEVLDEATAKRKIVVRKGKRKLIFKCGPGMMKKGSRTCVRRPGSQLRKMKLRARRAARKSKRKRTQAARKRNISLRKRASLGLRPRRR
jgi:hypothetical protein